MVPMMNEKTFFFRPESGDISTEMMGGPIDGDISQDKSLGANAHLRSEDGGSMI